MEMKNQKLKSSNTSSTLKKNSKYQNETRVNINKNNNINNPSSIFNINKNGSNNNNNCKLLKLTHSNNIFSNEKDKNKNNKKQIETKNNKLILGMEEEKQKEKVRQNSYTGLIKTEECPQNLVNKNISINKRSFLGKTSNFSPFKTKYKKDISINNENINNNNVQKNNSKFELQNKKNVQFKTLIKVKEKKKKFTRTFSGYAAKRKSSMNNKNTNNNNNNNINNNKKTNYSQNKLKDQNNINNNSNKNFINNNNSNKNMLSNNSNKNMLSSNSNKNILSNNSNKNMLSNNSNKNILSNNSNKNILSNNSNKNIINNNNCNKNNIYTNDQKSKKIISKSAKKCKIKNYLNNTVVKSSKIKELVNPIIDYREKSPIANCSYQNNIGINNANNDKNMNKTGNNFYENKIKKKFFNGNINNIGNTNKNINKTENIISINLKEIETNNNKNFIKDNVKNDIINIKVKMTNKIIPVNSIRDKQIFVEQNNQEPIITTTTKNTSKKKVVISANNTNNVNKHNNANNNNNNENTIKLKNGKKHKHNSAKYSKNKVKKIKNKTESKSQNKSTKINLEKQFDNNNINNINTNTNSNNNTLKKSNQNLNNNNNNSNKNYPSDKIINKKIKDKDKDKSKGKEKEKEKERKTKKQSANVVNNDFSTISHRAKNNTKGSSLSTIKTNKTTNTNVIKCSNIDCLKKKFIEGPLTINEIEENNDSSINNGYSFIINIISNWGNKKQVGMTEIELFDYNNKKIKINNIKIKGGEGSGSENVNRLFNNKIHTVNENEMWAIDINKNNTNSQDINIYLFIYANIDKNKTLLENINYIIIWNYNGWEVNKGIKKIEIFKNDNIYFSGVVTRGDHTILSEHPFKITFRKKYITKKMDNQKGSSINIYNNKFNSLKVENKHERENSFDCNYISCNISVSNKNFKYNKMSRKKVENESMKNQRNVNFSFLKAPSKKKTEMDLISLFSTFKNHISSSRSYNKEKKNNSYLNIGYRDKLNAMQNFPKNINHYGNLLVNSNSTTNVKSDYDSKTNNIIIKNDNGIVKNIVIKNKIFTMKNQSYDNKKNYKSNTEKTNKLLTNIKSIKFNNVQNIIYNSLRNEESSKKNSIFLSNTLRVGSFTVITQKNIPYISVKKIRINILSNYGNQLSVGLTGIYLIDNHSKKIPCNSASSIGALPKDLRTVYENEKDCRIFENLFNDINNTTDENNMWLTLISHEPYIEICFDDYINLSAIEIWNYNEPMSLDNGVKEIEIIFDEDQNKKYNLFLWKGLGINYYNYYQKIKCDEHYLKKLSNKYNKLKKNSNSINLPIGFIFKIVFISNYGDEETISLKKMELFNEKGEKLEKYNIIIDPNYTINIRDGVINDLLADDYLYYHEFYDFHKNKDSLCNNNLYICYDEIVQIKYIKMDNTNDERFKLTSTKEIQIYCDDILLYEGKLKQMGENIINFDNNNINNNTKNNPDINEDDDKTTAENNYKAYKEIINDGIYRLVLEK